MNVNLLVNELEDVTASIESEVVALSDDFDHLGLDKLSEGKNVRDKESGRSDISKLKRTEIAIADLRDALHRLTLERSRLHDSLVDPVESKRNEIAPATR